MYRSDKPTVKRVEKKVEIESDSSDEEDLKADEEINEMQVDFTNELINQNDES